MKWPVNKFNWWKPTPRCLADFVRGLADEETKTKVFALRQDNCTAENVLKLVKDEELGKKQCKGLEVAQWHRGRGGIQENPKKLSNHYNIYSITINVT